MLHFLRFSLLMAAIVATLITPSTEAFAFTCAQEDEAPAFALRHLQSRLMVAALSCNQADAYNSFVTRFTSELSDSGATMIAYFRRTGGGAAELNRQVTDIANAAGRSRSADPAGYCQRTWRVFWELEQAPDKLIQIAFDNLLDRVSLPPSCPGGLSSGLQVAKEPGQ